MGQTTAEPAPILQKLGYVFPAEMVTIKMQPRFLEKFHGDALRVDVEKRG